MKNKGIEKRANPDRIRLTKSTTPEAMHACKQLDDDE